jgi:hypothetical protein
VWGPMYRVHRGRVSHGGVDVVWYVADSVSWLVDGERIVKVGKL